MGKRGRPRQSGKRKNGRLIKTGLAEGIRQANDNALARRDLFGTNGWDAIGRAYAVGLLGEGDEAKDRLEKGRAYADWRQKIFGVGGYVCALDRSPRGGTGDEDPFIVEVRIARRRWLVEQGREMERIGCAPWVDMLVDPLRLYTDHDPCWLAHLIDNALANRARALSGQAKLPAEIGFVRTLEAALKGLDALTPFRAISGRAGLERRAA